MWNIEWDFFYVGFIIDGVEWFVNYINVKFIGKNRMILFVMYCNVLLFGIM